MKNPIFDYLLLAFLFVSFNCPNDDQFLKNAESTKISQISDTIPRCFSSAQIYAETAFLWQASWVTYYNKYGGGEYNDSPQLHFEEDKLNALFLEVSNEPQPGVILWYVLLNPSDPYPSLAIQNTISCAIDNNSTILLSPYDGGANTIILKNDLETYKEYWETAGAQNPGVYTEVFGYNYSWHSLRALIDANAAPSGIFVNYGLRTIEPNEIGYLQSPLTNKTGSVVYCNVIYDSQNEGNPLSSLDDFAMPCPIYCGDN